MNFHLFLSIKDQNNKHHLKQANENGQTKRIRSNKENCCFMVDGKWTFRLHDTHRHGARHDARYHALNC